VATAAVFCLTELKFGEPDATLELLVQSLKTPKPKLRALLLEAIGTFDKGAKPQ
jgi:hypothetical protein